METRSTDTTSAVMDALLKLLAGGSFITIGLAAPNAIQALDKPMAALFNKLDERSRARETRRILYYMKQRGLISYKPRDYQHGIQLTAAGKRRLENNRFKNLAIPAPAHWDHKWRLVFFDIPEQQRSQRNRLVAKLRGLGFQQLQRSIWVHPFPCRAEIEVAVEAFGVRRFVTYVELLEIDNKQELEKRLKNLLSA
jgi:DNA-binding transcriptional regulator PaaX